MIVDLIETLYRLLWGDLFTLPVAGGIGISFMVVLLFAAGIGFTLRTRLLPVRLFRDMIAAVCEKKQGRDGLSSFQTLIISTGWDSVAEGNRAGDGMACNNSDRRQWRKQGAVVGAAASEMQADAKQLLGAATRISCLQRKLPAG